MEEHDHQGQKRSSYCFLIILFLAERFIFQGIAIANDGPPQSILDQFNRRTEASLLGELEWAFGTEKGKTQKTELLLEPEIKIDLPGHSRLTAIVRGYAEPADELEPGKPAQREISGQSRRFWLGRHSDLALREFYLEGSILNVYATVGKQQIVWGKADGLKILDIVNPQDFREFILDAFEDSRMPLWTFNMEASIQGVDVQMIWIPDQSYHRLPKSGAVYAFRTPLLVPTPSPGVPVDIRPVEKPDRFFADSDLGFRLSTFWGGWDFTLNYLYHYDDLPVLFQRITSGTDGPLVTVSPRYQRTHLIGGTFSNAFGDLTIRGETGYSFDRFFLSDAQDDIDGVVKVDLIEYVFGFDWYRIEETLISFQIFQSWVTPPASGLVRDHVDTTLTFLLQRWFLNDTLVTEMIWLHNLNNKDGLIRPKVRYALRDHVTIWAGIDTFYGAKKGFFGQFNQNDRVVFGVEWGI